MVSNAQLAISDGKATLSVTWENAGIAPFYFDWMPFLRLSDSTGRQHLLSLDLSLRKVLPGFPVTVNVPLDTLPQGTWDADVAIINPETGTPGVELAMDTPVQSGWYRLLSFSL